MATINQTMGMTAFRDTLTSGGDIASLLGDLYINSTSTTTDIFVGAVSSLLAAYVNVRAAGLAPHVEDTDLDKFLHGAGSAMAASLTQKMAQVLDSRTDDAANRWMEVRLSAMVRAVVAHRDRITWPAPTAAAPAAPEPIAVRVVGMPDRVTETAVTYDTKTGDIKSTTQTERDAADSKA